MLVACCLLCGFGFAVPMLCFSVFIAPMVATFESSVTEVNLYFTFTPAAGVVSCAFGAALLQRSMRACVVVGTAVYGCAYIALALFPSLPMVWTCGIVAGLCYPLCSVVLIPIAINNWFAKSQGTFIGLSLAMVGVFGMIFSPVLTALISRFGWQATLVMLAVLTIVANVLVAAFLLRQSPEAEGLVPYGASEASLPASGEGGPGREGRVSAQPSRTGLLSTAPFWLSAAAAVFSGYLGSFNSQVNAATQASGFDATTAGFVLSCASVGLLVGKIVMGWMKDRRGSVFAMTAGSALGAAAFSVVTAGIVLGQPALLYVGASFTGFCTCLATMAPALLASEAFAPEDYNRTVGYITSCCSLGLALGAPIFSLAFDITGSYVPAMAAGVVVPVVVTLLGTLGIRRGKSLMAQEANAA